MPNLLLWLGVPLLLLPVVATRHRLGLATSQLIIAGLGLGALKQGVATLDPSDLRDIASRSPHTAWFIGITAGVLITGACIVPGGRSWRKDLLAVPLLVGLLFSISAGAVVAVLVGALVGVIPLMLARLALRSGAPWPGPPEDTRPPFAERSTSLVLGVLTIASALFGPLAVTVATLCLLVWKEWSLRKASLAGRRVPILPIVATGLLGTWLWFALTIAGSPSITLVRFATDAPVSAAASVVLALLATGWGIAIAAPWPLDRLADVSVQLPVLGVVLYLAVHAAPDGMAHWQPLLTVVMVPVTIIALASGRWDGAAAALLLLGATRPGPGGIVAVLLLAIVPAGRRAIESDRAGSSLAGVAVAMVVAMVLRDQVVLAVVLALGVAAVAIRRDRVVAPV
jgi:hypothetical protein